MLEMLTHMSEMTFLIYFIGLAIICLGIGKLIIQMSDSSTKNPLPAPDQFDYLSIAALNGSSKNVFLAALFNLWQQGLLSITGKADSTRIQSMHTHSEYERPKVGLEETIFFSVQNSTKVKEVLALDISKYLQPIYQQLEDTHLLQTAQQKLVPWLVMAITLFILDSAALTKIYLSLTNKQNFLLTIAALVIATAAAFFLYNPTRRTTQLGQNYLKSLNAHYAHLAKEIKDKKAKSADHVYAVAIFGVSVLAGVAVYSPFVNAFDPENSSDTGGGCGGGCGGG